LQSVYRGDRLGNYRSHHLSPTSCDQLRGSPPVNSYITRPLVFTLQWSLTRSPSWVGHANSWAGISACHHRLVTGHVNRSAGHVGTTGNGDQTVNDQSHTDTHRPTHTVLTATF